jgi:hypothetical protein
LQVGNCTIFARYVETGFATQVILNARLTRFYERDGWKRRLSEMKDSEPLQLERGIALKLPSPEPHDKLREAAQSAMDKVSEKAGGAQFTPLAVMQAQYLRRNPATKGAGLPSEIK